MFRKISTNAGARQLLRSSSRSSSLNIKAGGRNGVVGSSLRSTSARATYHTLKTVLPKAVSPLAKDTLANYKSSLPEYDLSQPVSLFGEAPFKKILAANRGEIATRIMRGATELGVKTAGIYSHEGKFWYCLKHLPFVYRTLIKKYHYGDQVF